MQQTSRTDGARGAIATLLLVASVACSGSASAGGAESGADSAGVRQYVDSALTMAEHERRLRTTISERPTRLAGGERSMAALLRAFEVAVRTNDTTALRRLHLSRAEFAYLYFPSSPTARPPYELDPALLWFQIVGETEKGMSRLLPRYGGSTFRIVAHACAELPRLHGENRLWGPCRVAFTTPDGDTAELQLFGSIVEREGHFKFVSYGNKL